MISKKSSERMSDSKGITYLVSSASTGNREKNHQEAKMTGDSLNHLLDPRSDYRPHPAPSSSLFPRRG